MIDFSTLQGLTIPEGVVTEIKDANGVVLWVLPVTSGPVVLEVEKMTSDTYAGETTYTGEQFILLNIYPKTNGTVNVTYGGLTKTITDTSGAEKPNAQTVFFGTFNGVSDEVETPASGTLTIEGDYYAFSCPYFSTSSKNGKTYMGITEIKSFGSVTELIGGTAGGFTDVNANDGCTFKYADLPNTVVDIQGRAFAGCKSLEWVKIPASVETIGENPFYKSNPSCAVSIHGSNQNYKMDGNCLIEISSDKLISGFNNGVIPSYVTEINNNAFSYTDITEITIPAAVKKIGIYPVAGCTSLTKVTFENTANWTVAKKDGSEATSVDVSDPANNVTLLQNTYSSYHWSCS